MVVIGTRVAVHCLLIHIWNLQEKKEIKNDVPLKTVYLLGTGHDTMTCCAKSRDNNFVAFFRYQRLTDPKWHVGCMD